MKPIVVGNFSHSVLQGKKPFKKEEDTKSIFVQNVDYHATRQELQSIFEDCGQIIRITIPKVPSVNKSKGYAYIEFNSAEAVFHALILSGTTLRNRTIKVANKRTNVVGMKKQKISDFLLSKMCMMKDKQNKHKKRQGNI